MSPEAMSTPSAVFAQASAHASPQCRLISSSGRSGEPSSRHSDTDPVAEAVISIVVVPVGDVARAGGWCRRRRTSRAACSSAARPCGLHTRIRRSEPPLTTIGSPVAVHGRDQRPDRSVVGVLHGRVDVRCRPDPRWRGTRRCRRRPATGARPGPVRADLEQAGRVEVRRVGQPGDRSPCPGCHRYSPLSSTAATAGPRPSPYTSRSLTDPVPRSRGSATCAPVGGS